MPLKKGNKTKQKPQKPPNFTNSLTISSTPAVINVSDGTFNITGNGVGGEGTFTIANGKAEIGLHMIVGQVAQETGIMPVPANTGEAVNTLKTTDQSDHTETEIIFTQEGKSNHKSFPSLPG